VLKEQGPRSGSKTEIRWKAALEKTLRPYGNLKKQTAAWHQVVRKAMRGGEGSARHEGSALVPEHVNQQERAFHLEER